MNDENGTLAFFSEDRFDPCKVCGEPSSGWHCGAVTCEACKKFFLRSINGEDIKYKCIRNQDCVIVRATRTQCQFCRFKKCIEVGMTIHDNSANPTVAELFKGIPCSVCEAPSSGYHFGAVTCEGCKGFFRRSIKERAPEKYKCLEKGNCEINLSTRNMCRYCRYQRCIQAGMSSDNSRIGRQSNLFKHQIMELQSKGIKAFSGSLISRKPKRTKTEPASIGMNDNFEHNNNNNHQHQMNSFIQNNNFRNYEHINLNQIQPIQNLNTINQINNLNTPNMNINIIAQQQIIQNHHFNTDYIPINNNELYSNSNTNNLSFSDPNMQPQPLSQQQQQQGYQMNGSYNPQMETVTQSNSTIYYTWSSNLPPNVIVNEHNADNRMMIAPQYRQPQQQISTVCIEDSLEDSVKCMIKVIYQSYTEYLSNLVDTINNELLRTNMFNNNMNYQDYPQQQFMLQHHHQQQQPNTSCVGEILRYLNFYAKKVLSFSQNIPGLSMLSNEDKEELVKCSIHSVILLSIQRRCNYLNYFNCDSIKFERFAKKLPRFNTATYFMKSLREKFDKYKLDDKEYGLYSALIVISTACYNLENYDKINEVRESIGNALRKYMIARRNEDISCDEIVMMLSHFKKVNSILQSDMFDFYKRTIDINVDVFKDNQMFYKCYLPSNPK